jgi:hypothetical protein
MCFIFFLLDDNGDVVKQTSGLYSLFKRTLQTGHVVQWVDFAVVSVVTFVTLQRM